MQLHIYAEWDEEPTGYVNEEAKLVYWRQLAGSWELEEAKDKRKKRGQKRAHKMEEHAIQFLLLPAINPCLLLYFGGENG